MRILAPARALAAPLALAASLSAGGERHKVIAALEAVKVTAGEGGESVEIAANVLDFAITLSVSDVTVEAPGSVAVHGQRLAALVARFPGDAMVTLTAEGAAAGVACGRSRFKLPIIPVDDMLAPLAVAEETGRLELSRADAIRALDAPLVAVGNELSRYYLMGVYLHAADGALATVATDGHQLVRCRFPGVDGFTTGLILPRAAVKIVLKLLADKAIEQVTLRRSSSLCAIEGPRFVFTSKLIDGTFPNYQRVIPQPSSNAVIVDRGALLQALGRLGAVADDNLPEIVGLQWSAGESVLRLCLTRQADLADDVVDAEVTGAGHIATSLEQLSELIDGLAGERVRLDAGDPSRPLLITDLGDENLLALVTPCAWFSHEEVAA